MKRLFSLALTLALTFGFLGILNAQVEPTEVSIDIRPCIEPNYIVLNGNGLIPVAILTTDEPLFDATTVDPTAVTFGPGAAQAIHSIGCIKDVDEDGDLDMILLFKIQDTGITLDDESACIAGLTTAGVAITGCDSVEVVERSNYGPAATKRRRHAEMSNGPNGPEEPNGPNGPNGPEGPKGPKKAPGLRASTSIAWGKIKCNN